MSRSPPRPAPLERRLGPLDAAAIIVSNVIGGGILFTPPQVEAMVPSPGRFCSRGWPGARSRARWPTLSSALCAPRRAASTSTSMLLTAGSPAY
jgi:hypothetical protein